MDRVCRVTQHDAAERPDGSHASLPAEALTLAAHCSDAELADARRVIHQHIARHQQRETAPAVREPSREA